MNALRLAADLQWQIGDELFDALVSSDNTDAVRKFAERLVKYGIMPTEELTDIGPEKRAYDMLSFLPEGKTSVGGLTMVERAEEMNAHSGEDDGQYLLDNQQNIPPALRGKVSFVFTAWRHPDRSACVYCVFWGGGQWVGDWFWLDDDDWDVYYRVLRRK